MEKLPPITVKVIRILCPRTQYNTIIVEMECGHRRCIPIMADKVQCSECEYERKVKEYYGVIAKKSS